MAMCCYLGGEDSCADVLSFTFLRLAVLSDRSKKNNILDKPKLSAVSSASTVLVVCFCITVQLIVTTVGERVVQIDADLDDIAYSQAVVEAINSLSSEGANRIVALLDVQSTLEQGWQGAQLLSGDR
jgi:hypothetical protein